MATQVCTFTARKQKQDSRCHIIYIKGSERQFGASSCKPGPSPDSPIRAPWHMNFSIWITVWVGVITLDVNSESLQLSRHTRAPICLLRKPQVLLSTWRAFRTFVLDLSRFKLPLGHHMATTSSLLLETAKARNSMDGILLTAPPQHLHCCSMPTSFLLHPDSQSAHEGGSFICCCSFVESGQSRLKPRRHSA